MYFFTPQNRKILFEYLKQNRGWLCFMLGAESFQKKNKKKMLYGLLSASDVR